MKYEQIEYAKFHQKINRFIAEVFIDEEIEKVHIKNTGRLRELLVQGADVVLERSNNPNRETRYSLIAVWKNENLVNIDSQAPNVVAYDAILAGRIREVETPDVLKREVTYRDSRFDLYYEKGDVRRFIEVKGVTLEKDGIAMFPDAPTKRGTKHIRELIHAVEDGYKAAILFIVQMKGCHAFIPHVEMDAAFVEALETASEKGVDVIAYDAKVTERKIILDQAIPVQ